MKPKQLRSSLPPAKPSAAAQHGILNLVARGRIDEAAATLGSSGLSLTVSDPAGDNLKMLGLSEHQLSLLQALGRYASAAEQSPARWYALGDLELLAARPAKAIDAFRACLQLSPGHVGTLLRLAKSLRAVGRKGEAVAALQRATALAPGSGKAHNEAGQIYLELNEAGLAVRSFQAAVSIDKKDFAALFNLANCQKSLGNGRDAIATYSLALQLDPRHVEALNNRGAALQVLDRDVEALRDFDAAVSLDRRHHFAWINKGVSHYKLDQLTQSISAFETALAINPGTAEIFHNFGLTLMKLDRHEEAIGYFETASLVAPEKQQGLLSKGNALHALHRYIEAVEVFQQAIHRHPTVTDAYVNMAGSLQELAKHEDAIEILDASLKIRPGYSEALWNKANSMLAFGPTKDAWSAYEHRLHISVGKPLEDYGLPLLGDESAKGKRLLIQWEQRFGDVIQMLRYAPFLDAVSESHWQVAEPMIDMVKASFPNLNICGIGECPTGLAVRTPYTSLPLNMGTFSLDSIPNKVPYLKASASAVAKWQGRTEALHRRIGITWRGNPNPPGRSIPIEDMVPLLEACGEEMVSLQMDVTLDERRTLERFAIPDLGRELKTFDESAGLLAQLDLVISIDTAVAHLAGALGIKTWILLKYGCDWRWLLERRDSPWYPTVTLYRQKRVGEWQDVVEQVRVDLA